ncbi:MAG: RIP metalloprotease RseP [Patescibacteria group bacterium]|nr:RIP metalloprotease RseP [Patescibacteria group bacterium]
MLLTIIVLVALLSLLVFVHELGHFATAKFFGIKVEEFGFGFPPRLWGFRRGDTDYTLNWIPLGGFVRIKGEAGEASSDRDSFAGRPAWQRVAVLCAGVTMNFLLAWFLMTVGYAIGLQQIADELPASARVRDAQVLIYSVVPNSPAAAVGLAAGDELLTVDGQPIADIEAFRAYTVSRGGQPIAVVFSRDGARQEKSVVPQTIAEANRVGIGVAVMRVGMVSYPLWEAPWRGLQATATFITQILAAFWALFRDLVTVQPVSVEFSGPVGIAVITADVIRLGFRHLLQFAALLSINLAVINIVPFPALDGGRVAFIVFERLRGRAIKASVENWAHQIGFALLLLLIVVVTYQDVVKFGGRIWNALGSAIGL